MWGIFMWTYEGKEFTSDDIGDHYGFVYRITDTSNGMMYIGKKWFWSVRTLPPLKGKKRKRKKVLESDWKAYYGSSEEVKTLVEEHGPDRFQREILKLCKTKGECSYYEAKLQFELDVLLDDRYYNSFIGCKIHSKHLGK